MSLGITIESRKKRRIKEGEKEWRLFYSRNKNVSGLIGIKIKSLNGAVKSKALFFLEEKPVFDLFPFDRRMATQPR